MWRVSRKSLACSAPSASARQPAMTSILSMAALDGLATRRAHGLERVDDDHPQVVVAVRELPELLHEAVADALRLHHAAEVVVRLVAKMLEARLDAAERVLQAQVQHGPPLGGEAPEGLSEGNMERQVEPKPRLADLGIARDERQPARDQPLHHPARLLEGFSRSHWAVRASNLRIRPPRVSPRRKRAICRGRPCRLRVPGLRKRRRSGR